MYSVAICDDEKKTCSMIEKVILAFAENRSLSIGVEIFYSGESLFNDLNQGNHFDLIFLDIEMDKMSGIDVSEKIRNSLGNLDTEIVYVTCTTKYDRKLFDYQPLGFIAKPPEKALLEKSLELALKRGNIKNPYFSFTYNRQIQNIPYNQIVYFESDDRKINVVTGFACHSYYGKLSDISASLPQPFCQIHRSYIVNLHQISAYGSHEITMNNKQKISVGKAYREQFLSRQLSALEEE